MILFIRIVGVKTFPIRGGLHQDITGPPTGLAQNLGLKKDLEEREGIMKEEMNRACIQNKEMQERVDSF